MLWMFLVLLFSRTMYATKHCRCSFTCHANRPKMKPAPLILDSMLCTPYHILLFLDLCLSIYTTHPSCLVFDHIVIHLPPELGCIWDQGTQDHHLGCVLQPCPAKQGRHIHREWQGEILACALIWGNTWPLLWNNSWFFQFLFVSLLNMNTIIIDVMIKNTFLMRQIQCTISDLWADYLQKILVP